MIPTTKILLQMCRKFVIHPYNPEQIEEHKRSCPGATATGNVDTSRSTSTAPAAAAPAAPVGMCHNCSAPHGLQAMSSHKSNACHSSGGSLCVRDDHTSVLAACFPMHCCRTPWIFWSCMVPGAQVMCFSMSYLHLNISCVSVVCVRGSAAGQWHIRGQWC